MKPKPYMNPYLAGFFLGLVLLATIFITGRGLGASGAVKSVVVSVVQSVAPEYHAGTQFYEEYTKTHPNGPLRSWLFFEIIGVLVGAFISGVISHRMALRLDKGPRVTNGIRIVAAIIGGALFGFGSQLARGCTSGAALSGMAVMSLGGLMTMAAIFGSAYVLAWFVRRLWVR